MQHRNRSLMDLSGMGLLPGLVVAMGIVLVAMAALMAKTYWMVALVLAVLLAVTGAVLLVVVAVLRDDEEDDDRLRRRIPGL